MADFDEIKRRVTIEDILINCGYQPRRNRMACPIHNGRNPTSFSFTEDIYHCFSCGASGGLLDLAQTLLHVDRRHALQYLADLAGLPRNTYNCNAPTRYYKPISTATIPDRNSKLDDLELCLMELNSLMDFHTRRIRNARKSLKAGDMHPSRYYAITQYAEYILQELNTGLIQVNYAISAEKKKLKTCRKA